jgi:hypothetical protein
MEKFENISKIVDSLFLKSKIKQEIYQNTLETFNEIKHESRIINTWMKKKFCNDVNNIEIAYSEKGDFQTELKIAGDTLVFFMHTNIFNFPNEHFIQKSSYIKADPLRSYCGTIMIYNFLSDSIKYQRMDDVGYLMCRIFVNKEKHFFIQGERQYSFLFKDFAKLTVDKKNVRNIILTAIKQAIDFDLLVPPIENISQINIMQKIQTGNLLSLKTGKRLGFDLDIYEKDIKMKKQ